MKNCPIGKVSSNLLSVIRISIFSWIIVLTKSNLLRKELTYRVAKIILFTFFILMFFKTSKTFLFLDFSSGESHVGIPKCWHRGVSSKCCSLTLFGVGGV